MNKILKIILIIVLVAVAGFGVLVGWEFYQNRDLSQTYTHDTLEFHHPASWQYKSTFKQPVAGGSEAEFFIFEIGSGSTKTVLIGYETPFTAKDQFFNAVGLVRTSTPEYEELSKSVGTRGSASGQMYTWRGKFADAKYAIEVELFDETNKKSYVLTSYLTEEAWAEHSDVIKRVFDRAVIK